MSDILTHTGPYVPRPHMKFRRWAFVLTSRIAENPESLRISKQVADNLQSAFERYNDAYALASKPGTRTKPIVGRMNAERKRLEKLCRMYGQQIKNDPQVDDLEKQQLFLRLGKKRRMVIHALDSCPFLIVRPHSSGKHELRYLDNGLRGPKRKPKDAVALQLFATVADYAVGDPKDARYVGTYTRQPFTVAWPVETAGKTISYFARWITASGKEGPWSLAASMQMAFGGLILAKLDAQREAA